jgi:hypothetical protein
MTAHYSSSSTCTCVYYRSSSPPRQTRRPSRTWPATVIIAAATQTPFDNGQYGHYSIATRGGPGTEAKASRYREQDRGVQGGPRARATAHQPPHQVRGDGFRIVRVDGPHSAEAGQRVGAAVLGPDRRRSSAGSSTRHELSSEIQYCNTGTRFPSSCGWARHPSPRTWMMGGRPSAVEKRVGGSWSTH